MRAEPLPVRPPSAPGWAVATFDREGITRAWCRGAADLRDGRTVTVQTPFRWFSVTKIITATAVMALVDRGALDLDDPVRRHLPWFRPEPADPPVRVHHLLSHSGGLANPLALRWVHPPGHGRREPERLTRAAFERHSRLRTMPGAAIHYTNWGYLLLGEIVRRISGTTFAEQIRRSVLVPAGIATAGFEPRGAVGHERTRSLRTLVMAALFAPRTPRLVAYVRDGWVGLTEFELEGQAYGGLVGSLEELVRVGRLHLGDGAIDGVRVLSPELARRMREPEGEGPLAEMGLGLWRLGDGWFGHAGEAGGFQADLRFSPSLGRGVAVLANAGAADVEAVAAALVREV